ncbi:MAG: DUF3486 family protein [Deltaproteobacteria bacterium]|nr:DUF3486 family protein [Deltaproteobacteria bacterium]
MAQRSSIARLPEDIREKLQELLRDPRVTQMEATERINAILEEDGHPDRVSKSSVNRYAVRMEEVGAKLRQSREVAKMWIGKLGAEPQGEVGKLLNEMVRSLAFEATMEMAEGSEPVPPKMIKDLSIAIERLERAATTNVKRDDEIRKRALEDAANAVEAAATEQGMSEDQAEFWRKKVLGVV